LTKHRDLLKKTGKADNSLWLVVIENKSAVICFTQKNELNPSGTRSKELSGYYLSSICLGNRLVFVKEQIAPVLDQLSAVEQ
jgi:hypothetical protein